MKYLESYFFLSLENNLFGYTILRAMGSNHVLALICQYCLELRDLKSLFVFQIQCNFQHTFLQHSYQINSSTLRLYRNPWKLLIHTVPVSELFWHVWPIMTQSTRNAIPQAKWLGFLWLSISLERCDYFPGNFWLNHYLATSSPSSQGGTSKCRGPQAVSISFTWFQVIHCSLAKSMLFLITINRRLLVPYLNKEEWYSYFSSCMIFYFLGRKMTWL